MQAHRNWVNDVHAHPFGDFIASGGVSTLARTGQSFYLITGGRARQDMGCAAQSLHSEL